MKDEFTSFQLAKAIGVEYQRLRGWIDAKALTPSVQLPDGIGTKALFNRTDVHMAGLLKECLALGMSRKEAARAIQEVRRGLQSMKNPGAVSHLLFVKRNGKFFGRDHEPVFEKTFKTVAAAVDDYLKNGQIPPLVLLDKKMFDELSFRDLMTWGGRVKCDIDYTAFIVINFEKIVENIDIRL